MASYYYLDNFTWAALTLETEKGINRRGVPRDYNHVTTDAHFKE